MNKLLLWALICPMLSYAADQMSFGKVSFYDKSTPQNQSTIKVQCVSDNMKMSSFAVYVTCYPSGICYKTLHQVLQSQLNIPGTLNMIPQNFQSVDVSLSNVIIKPQEKKLLIFNILQPDPQYN